MHKKISTTHIRLYDRILGILGLSFLVLFLLSTKAFAAAPCTLSFTATADKSAVTVGQTITRTLTLKNIAKTSCHSTSFSVYYSPNESYVSATPSATASNYYWNVGTLNAGKSVTTTITTLVKGATDNVVATEACATATGASDACVDSNISVTSTGTIVTPPPVTVTPAPIVPASTSTTVTPTPVITPTPTPISTGKEQGMWIWNFPSAMLTTAATQQLKDLAANGFNTVYITTDDYIDIASMSAGTAKTQASATYFRNLAQFVMTANSLGMQVDAEGGWRDWAYPANQWKGFALIDMVKAYNTANPNAKLRGFEYDVEPYLLPEYETNKASVLTQYVGFIDASVQRLVGTDIKFSITIPHFYDDVNQWTPPITYGGRTEYTYNQLLDILEKKPGSEILLMSYRNTFDGTNGTRAISETEVKEASPGYHTQVIVGQETGNVDPAYVTFYGMTRSAVAAALSTIGSSFASYANYAGTAVDYSDPYLALPQ
jgi:hypothetical protein